MKNMKSYGFLINSDTLLFAMIVLSSFLILAIMVSMMRIYKKAGKSQISAIIPIWSQIVLFQIVDIPFWWIFVPIANIVFMIKAYVLLAKKFGKGTGFAVGMVFLPMIFIPLLSFYDYVGEEEKTEEPVYNPFNETNVAQVMPTTPMETKEETIVPEAPVSIMEPQEVVQTDELPIDNQVEVDVPLNTKIIPEVAVENNPAPVLESLEQTPEVIDSPIVVEPIELADQPVIGEVIDPINNEIVEPSFNPTVEDIQTILSNNQKNNLTYVAFNTLHQDEPAKEEVNQVEVINIEQLSNDTTTLETIDVSLENNQNINSEEVIEMPEMAAKICPACGVSLAEDVKFCTSCGTQL